jgi:hydrogenase small subunit
MSRSERPRSTYDVLRAHGVDRRDFLRFCTVTTAAMGLEATLVPKVVSAMENQPRIPVIWLHGLECTCCSESFLRSSHPVAQDIVFNMISLDYDDTLQAAAGFQVEEIRRKIIKEHPGEYLLAVEGNAPTADGGMYCTVGGNSFLNILLETAEHAKAIIAWGSCASNGCVQAAKPNPTGAKPVHEILPGRTVINVPGCPPIAESLEGIDALRRWGLDSSGRGPVASLRATDCPIRCARRCGVGPPQLQGHSSQSSRASVSHMPGLPSM